MNLAKLSLSLAQLSLCPSLISGIAMSPFLLPILLTGWSFSGSSHLYFLSPVCAVTGPFMLFDPKSCPLSLSNYGRTFSSSFSFDLVLQIFLQLNFFSWSSLLPSAFLFLLIRHPNMLTTNSATCWDIVGLPAVIWLLTDCLGCGREKSKKVKLTYHCKLQ